MAAAGVVQNEKCPDWGMGLIIEEQPKNWVIFFENAGRKTFVKGASALKQVELPREELEALKTKVSGKQSARATTKKATKPRKPAGAKARFASFEEQLATFERIFPGGFQGEQFTADERGDKSAKGKKPGKAAAIAAAQSELSPAAFEKNEGMFETVKRILGLTTIVHPMEGSIPLNTLSEADQAAFVAGLNELLHGSGDYAERLEHFANAINLKGADKKAKKPGWPLATILGGFYFPETETCVKPTYYSAQGAIFGLDVNKSQPITAKGYRKFAEVAAETQKQLQAAGHKPRDLMDVYSFIWTTHDAKVPTTVS